MTPGSSPNAHLDSSAAPGDNAEGDRSAGGLASSPVFGRGGPATIPRAVGASLGAISLGAASVVMAPTASALVSSGEINGWPTYYEVPPHPASSFSYDAVFYSRLETWIQFFYSNTPYNWVTPAQIYSFGAYVNKPGYHGSGRAFDLSRIYLHVDGLWERVFNGRYDEWRSLAAGPLDLTRRRYFACAASINYHFRYTLTYLYDASHWNHIHMDNGVSGAGNSVFVTSWRIQAVSARNSASFSDGVR